MLHYQLGSGAYACRFNEPIVCILIAQSSVFTLSHYNNLLFCLHLFTPFAKQTTKQLNYAQDHVTHRFKLQNTVEQNVKLLIRFSKNDHHKYSSLLFAQLLLFMKGQITASVYANIAFRALDRNTFCTIKPCTSSARFCKSLN